MDDTDHTGGSIRDERDASDVVEVVLRWGAPGSASVLATKYLGPGDTFVAGEAEGCDVLLPFEVLGSTRCELASCDVGGATVAPPAHAQAWVDALPVAAAPIALGPRSIAEVTFGAFTLRARWVEREASVSFGGSVKANDFGELALSALAHAACFAALGLFLPALGATDDDGISRDQLLTMRHLLDASAEHEREAREDEGAKPADSPEDHGASGGGRAVGASGAMGSERAPKAPGHWTAAGDTPRELQSLSRDQKIAMVKDFGVLGLLATMNADPNAPTVPWGETLRGADHDSHLGGLFGPDGADSWGVGGLFVSGAEEGGGGTNLGVGINRVGNLSASLDQRIGSGDPGGWGHGCGGKPCLGGHTHVVGAGLRMPREITTNGRLPAEIIQRIVRQNMGRYRACYEGGLRVNPSLEGRVAVRFVIDRRGIVSVAQDAGGESDLPNEAVRSCIVKSFYSLEFPSPNDGTVTVTYPIVLTPSS
jgi:hypothetical protein